MNQYKLLTPGPLTTSDSVKKMMLSDRCTWDDDYKIITQQIRKGLLDLAGLQSENYTVVLMQGSGTFGVEATIGSTMSHNDKALIITNGAYGDRLVTIAQYAGKSHIVYAVPWDEIPDKEQVNHILSNDNQITHVIFVHCETTTGILNPLENLAKIVKDHDKTLIVDAMSSFGGVVIDIEKHGIDFLVSSSNKCIQGVPGFSFVIAKKELLPYCQGNSHSLSLDLFDQWKAMDVDGKWRYTSPTHVVAAFLQAMVELQNEGGVAAREKRYTENNRLLREKMQALGFEAFIPSKWQSPIITAFRYPDKEFSFADFYQYVKDRGYVLYPGKLTDEDTFRIGNIGEVYPEDMDVLTDIIANYVQEKKEYVDE